LYFTALTIGLLDKKTFTEKWGSESETDLVLFDKGFAVPRKAQLELQGKNCLRLPYRFRKELF